MNARNKFNDILTLLLPIIILVTPIIISMIISKVNIINILLIEFIVYIIAYIIKKSINNKIKIEPTFNQQYYRDIPQIKPALFLYYLKNIQYNTKNDFYATILDLINRNFFVLSRNIDTLSYKITVNEKKDFNELNKFEKNIIELLFLNSNKKEIEFSDLKRNIEEDKLFQERIDAWKMLVEIEARKNESEIKNTKIMFLKKICNILLIISLVMNYFLLLCGDSINKITYIIIIGISILSTEIGQIREKTFTQDIINELEKGKALKRYLEDYSLIDEKEVGQIKVWEGYLVYATILDTPQKIKKYFDGIFNY